MPFTGQDKVLLSDIVKGLSLAIIEVCRTLEQQKGMPAQEFVHNIDTAVTNLPHDLSRPMIKHILTNIAHGLDGKPLAPLHIE